LWWPSKSRGSWCRPVSLLPKNNHTIFLSSWRTSLQSSTGISSMEYQDCGLVNKALRCYSGSRAILAQGVFIILPKSFPKRWGILRTEFSMAKNMLSLGLCRVHRQVRHHPCIRLAPGWSCRKGAMVPSPQLPTRIFTATAPHRSRPS
jgi:hypothetical protein